MARGWVASLNMSPVRVGPNNLPVFVTDGGTELPLPIGQTPRALHSDASFEDPSFADWNLFWTTGTPTVTAETVDVLEAEQAMGVVLDDGEAQIVMSNVFTVTPGDVVDFGVWAAVTDGAPQIQLALVTGPSGTPDLFVAGAEIAGSGLTSLSGGYAQQAFSAQVPPTHTKARVYFRVTTTGGVGATVLLDLSFSAVTGSTATVAA